MRITHQYRLRPTKPQQAQMEEWLDKLRCQYNWLLSERFVWWEEHRSPVNACPLVCYLPTPKEQPDYYSQKLSLVPMKQARPWYKDIHSQVLQDMVKRVKLSFDRYIKGDVKGNHSGKPRFKGKGRYRSFTYPQASIDWIDGKLINLPKIGAMKVIWHRPLPNGFVAKTATITKKADSWYLNLSLGNKNVPEITPEFPTMENTTGIDMGLKAFLVTDEGEEVAIPQFYRKTEKKLKRLQRSLSRKKKGSTRRKKAIRRFARAHLRAANTRKDFHHKAAKRLVGNGNHIGHEALNIKGLARTRMAKSVNDAGWGTFLEILSIKAERAGLMTIPVNPNGTTQDCSGCGIKVPKTIQDRWHSCPNCGCELDSDHNAAINIKQRAVGHPVQALRGDRNAEPVKREALAVPVLRST